MPPQMVLTQVLSFRTFKCTRSASAKGLPEGFLDGLAMQGPANSSRSECILTAVPNQPSGLVSVPIPVLEHSA